MAASTYDQDFHRWTQEQADLLRRGELSAIDVDHLIEELETMGARERRELNNRLKILLAHLLKWRAQPERRGRSWRATIAEQRLSLQDLLDDNPSRRPSSAAGLPHPAPRRTTVLGQTQRSCHLQRFAPFACSLPTVMCSCT